MSRKGKSSQPIIYVRTSKDEIEKWDGKKIVEALIRETDIEQNLAEKISQEVEEQIISSKLTTVTASLIRELVDTKLVEYGLEEARRKHARLGVPLYDTEQAILYPSKENANIPHNPEASNLVLAEQIKKQFALAKVFSQDVADAHMRGDIHLHDLGYPDRPYCSGQNLEYVKKFGLKLPFWATAKPARHPEVLLEQMIKMSAALQGHFAGAIGWDAVNLFFAPYLVGLSNKEIHQLAQMMIFELSQQSVARGGQTIFSDLNLYWEVPRHFEDVPAIGPGGEYTGKTYRDYLKEAQKFIWALFDVYKEGDAEGKPFFFPKPLLHITSKFFETPGHERFLNHISEVASLKGNTYFVFDRGDTYRINECCRLAFELDSADLAEAKQPWKMRYSALQNVSINLPRVAYLSKGKEEELFDKITQLMELAAKAHLQKRTFLEKLLKMGEKGPLALLAIELDGEPYLRMHRATHLFGIVGLNELVQAHTGKELHESEEALKFGLKIISHMKLTANKLSKKHGLRFVLEQTPAEHVAYRFATLDMKHFPKEASRVVKGNIDFGEIYYTNSTYLNVGAPIDPIERVTIEGMFHPLIEAGWLSHIWLGEAQPPPESIANFVTKVFKNTHNSQIAFSPEFTSCLNCGKITRGLLDSCAHCGSKNIEGITRITGYFSRTTRWNKGKLGELKDRHRVTL
ncbi:MAG: anaerobic ribonucleoside-triphosphate reductase [Actinomycetota bacterium]